VGGALEIGRKPSMRFRGCIQTAGQKQKDTKVGLKAAKNSEVEGNGLNIKIKHVAEEQMLQVAEVPHNTGALFRPSDVWLFFHG